METYKFGNKSTAIIRSFGADTIGITKMDYSNEPYVIINNAEAQLSFGSVNTVCSTGAFNELAYNNSQISEIRFSNVLLNSKILNLIFNKSETKLVSRVEICEPNHGYLYLTSPTTKIYQVFVFNSENKLVQAYDSLRGYGISIKFPGLLSNEIYTVCYQYEVENAVSLNSPANHYFTIDLITPGNQTDTTVNYNVHIHKCALRANPVFAFSQKINSVDLVFTVINTKEDFIAIDNMGNSVETYE